MAKELHFVGAPRKRSPMEELTLELGAAVCESGEWMEENCAGLMEELCRVLRGGTVSQGDPMVTGSPVRSDWASA